MANDTSLTYSLYGRDINASKSLKGVGDAANQAHGAFSNLKTIAAGVFAGNVMENAAAKVVDFAKESINKFQQVGGEIKNLQRYTGGTAESMSALRETAQMSGVQTDSLAMALGKLSKFMDSNKHASQLLGVEVKDASGHLKNMDAVLPSIMDHFAKMPNGAQKTADVLKVFGRNGMEILPFLNQGSAGLAKFTEEAKRNGLILSQDSINSLKANVMAQREFHSAIEGVQVSLGQALYPALTKVMEAFTKIIPYIRELVDILVKVLKPAIEAISKVIEPIGSIFGNLLDMATGKTKEGAAKLKTQFSQWGEAAWKWVESVYPKLLNALENMLTKFVGWVNSALPKILDKLDSWRSAFILWIPKAITGMLNEASKLGNALVDYIGAHGKDIVASLLKWTAEFVLFVIKAIPPMLEALAKLTLNITVWIVTKGVPLILKAVWNLGKALIEGMWQGILDSTSMFLSKLGNWVSEHIPGFLKKLLGISSPSKVTAQIGGFIVEGLVEGITGNVSAISNAMTKVSDAIVNGFKGTTPKVIAAMQATLNAAKSSISRFSSDVNAIFGVSGAQGTLAGSQSNLSALQAEKASLPDAIAQAMARVSQAQSISPYARQSAYEDASAAYKAAIDAGESTAKLTLLANELSIAQENLGKPTQDVIDAQKALSDLQLRSLTIDRDILTAQQDITKATIDLTKSQLDSKLATIDLNSAIASLGKAAGLSAPMIASLLSSVQSFGSSGSINSLAQAAPTTSSSGLYSTSTPIPHIGNSDRAQERLLGFATGGIVTKPTVALIGEGSESEAVIPLSRLGNMGGGMNVVVNVHGSVVQEHDLAVTVRDQIAQMIRRRGLSPSILGV
jgi:TP901 family phage tail tape measure protein